MLYERNNLDLKRGSFRAKGDVLEIIPVNQHGKGLRIEFFDEEGIDLDGMVGEDILEAEEVFDIGDGRYLIVEG